MLVKSDHEEEVKQPQKVKKTKDGSVKAVKDETKPKKIPKNEEMQEENQQVV